MREKLSEDKEIKHLDTVYESRVKFNEADPLGIVWHGNYIAYFEEGREFFGREHGISYLDIHKHGYSTPIVKSTCNHLKPLKYAEVFTVKTSLVHTPAAKMIFNYYIHNSNGELVCYGQTIQAFVNSSGNLSLYCPDFYIEWKNKNTF